MGDQKEREAIVKLCREAIEHLERERDRCSSQFEETGDDRFEIEAIDAERERESWKRALNPLMHGILQPLFVDGDSDFLRALSRGKVVTLEGPTFEHGEAAEAFDAVSADQPQLTAIGKSHLAAAARVRDELIASGVDVELLNTLADFMFSAGRFREQVIAAEFNSKLIRHQADQEKRASGGSSTGILQTEEDRSLFRIELEKHGNQWKKIAEAMTKHGRKMDRRTAKRYVERLAQVDNASAAPK